MKRLINLSIIFSFSFLLIIFSLPISYTDSDKTSSDFPIECLKKEENIVNETILEILQIETYPTIAIVNQPVFINITVKNNGQFSMAEIKNVKAEANLNISDKELYLEGSISDLAPGEIQIASFNLTFLEAGYANVTFTFSAENIQDTSTILQIQVKDDNTSTLKQLIFPIIGSIFLIAILTKPNKVKF